MSKQPVPGGGGTSKMGGGTDSKALSLRKLQVGSVGFRVQGLEFIGFRV